MNDITVVSIPGKIEKNLLSLNEDQFGYMRPFFGRFRSIDFLIRNACESSVKNLVIINKYPDKLNNYIKNYSRTDNKNLPDIELIFDDAYKIEQLGKKIEEVSSDIYIIYSGEIPSIINFQDIISKFKKGKAKASLFQFKTSGKPSSLKSLLLIQRKHLLKIIKSEIANKGRSKNIFELIVNHSTMKNIKSKQVEGNQWLTKNVNGFHSINLDIINKQSLSKTIFHNNVKGFIKNDEHAFIGPDAEITCSFISDSCRILGNVFNSVIFPGVHIGVNTVVKDSVILPFVKIGDHVKLTNTIIDETTEFNPSGNTLNIGNNCKIGSSHKDLKNKQYPAALKNGLTLIGKNCRIPDNAGIGGACYIASRKGEQYLLRNKYLYNGESIG